MSYRIGQFRRDMLSSSRYLNNISYELVPMTIDTDSSLGTAFTDFALRLSTGLQYNNSYYIRLGFRRLETQQTVIVSLRNQSQTNTNSQTLENFKIPAADNSINQTVIVELAFSPNAAYDLVMLTLQRTAYDYTVQNEYGTSGRVLDIDSDEIVMAEVYNVLNTLGVNTLNKVGIQGPPGLLMCINGQDIRVGPSGIYEIKNDYKITSIGFVVRESDQTPDGRDYFILDYQY